MSMYMHYQHRTIREASVLLIAPLFSSVQSLPDVAENRRSMLKKGLQTLEAQYFADGQPYLVGNNLTLADLACYSELGQLLPQFHNLWDFNDYPRLQDWFSRMAQVCKSVKSMSGCIRVPSASSDVCIRACVRVCVCAGATPRRRNAMQQAVGRWK